MKPVMWVICGYVLFISLLAVSLTVHDKRRAKRHGRRIPERTLMLVGLLGGAPAMYATMRMIRHKTLHRKFMWGLPAEIALQAALICAAAWIHLR